MPDAPLHEFLLTVARVHRSGAATEPTYYPAIEELLSTVGERQKPHVRAVMSLKQLGAGMPDGGLYTAEQLAHGRNAEGAPPLNPGRGAVEAKLPTEPITTTIKSMQVRGYAQRHGTVLVTNLREWSLLEARDGDVHEVERFSLAASADDFWKVGGRAKAFAEQHGAEFEAFLQRAMLHRAPLSSPEDLARILAVYAREGLRRAETATKATGLAAIRAAFSEALGFEVKDKEGEHFFRSSLIQTLFYGAFSAWVVWCRENAPGRKNARFEWKSAVWLQHQPAIAVLYDHLVKPGPMNDLRLTEVLDWAGDALDRVDRAAFFERFSDAQAVQYFYEPFLAEFDPDLRRRLGVWYTPPEIVEYMVERVDRVLRTELGIERGLADENVVILDPCCGTGSFVVEVLRRIHKTEIEQGAGALAGERVRQAAETRVAGFEIMPAPFVVAHMQVALLLQGLGVPIPDTHRAAVYLSNALTGWDAPDGVRDTQFQMSMSAFAELLAERDQARAVKRDQRVLVVLGNPPYNAFAGIAGTNEQRDLIKPYKDGLDDIWGIKKYNLDELYVQFFRLAERRIAEQTGEGIVCFISNHSWLSDPSFVVMREHLRGSFDQFWIENMHGDRKISERAPDGRTSETIFAMPGFSPGIQQGVAISLWLRRRERTYPTEVRFRDDLTDAHAANRRRALLDSLADPEVESHYTSVYPSQRAKYSFRPGEAGDEWYTWPEVPNLAAFRSNGLMEKRGGGLIDINRDALATRMQKYFTADAEWEDVEGDLGGLAKDAGRFNARQTWTRNRSRVFDPSMIRRFAVRPFDTRWCFATDVRPIWNEPRPELLRQAWPGSRFVLTVGRCASSPYGAPFAFTQAIPDDHFLRTDAFCFPIVLAASPAEALGLSGVGTAPNLSPEVVAYLSSRGVSGVSAGESIWMHVLGVGYSGLYQRDHAHGLRAGWPRIPLPDDSELLQRSSALGVAVADLLDTEAAVRGVDGGTIRAGLRAVGVLTVVEPVGPDDGLELRAGWGHFGRDGVVMPARGKFLLRDYTPEERAALATEAMTLGLSAAQVIEVLGDQTYDITLNGSRVWRNVPQRVWDYYIGGYQVLKKWLSYREHEILGRALTTDEAQWFQSMARRLAALRLLEPRLDANYQAVRAAPALWPPESV